MEQVVTFQGRAFTPSGEVAARVVEVCDCGHVPSEHGMIDTGYALDPGGQTLCYDCCAERERADMLTCGVWVAYLTKTGGQWFVGNWAGRLQFRAIVETGAHNMARRMYHAWITGPDGRGWYGKCSLDRGALITMRRLKG